MAKRLTTVAPQEIDSDPDDDPSLLETSPPPASPEASDVDTAMEFMRSAGSVYIHRQDPETKQFNHLTRIDPADFDFEYIKNEYGGGRYRALLYDENKKYKKCHTFSIDSIFKPKQRAIDPSPFQPAPLPIQPASSEMGELKSLIKELISLQISRPPQQDPMEMALKLAQVLSRPQAPPPTASGSGGWSEAFTIFQQGVEMGRSMDGDNGYGPVIEGIGKPLMEMLSKQSQNGDKIVKKAQTIIPEKVEPPKTFDTVIAHYIPQLIGLAKRGKEPALYAELVLDQIPEPYIDSFVEWINRGDVLDVLSQKHPEVTAYHSWFTDFVTAIRESFTMDSDDENPEGVQTLSKVNTVPLSPVQ